ncbi:hypothetical protein BJV82DRAFT_72389 [Fennellomyces sp. T-0311]|nr:hypothetical protein BJV82DRAFT_72389 [Fennellomyces sp. T-0311]
MFSIPDDTQVYTTDAQNQFYAFTHHLALFDINARGYVHPVALSYITWDPEKIVWRYEDFSERFNEVARLMKKGNFSNFALDLKCRLMDLEYTQKQVSHDDEKKKCNISVEAMQQAITVTKLMIDTVESYVVQLMHEATPELLSEQSSTTGTGSRKASDGFLVPTTPSSIPETPSDTKPEGPIFPLLALMPHGHEDQVKSFFEKPSSDYEPKFVDTLHPVAHFERKLRSLAQLCQEPKQYRKRGSLPTTVIPLVSAIEPRSEEENLKPTFASTISQDMYAEAIKYMMEMTHDFGHSSEILDLIEDEEMYLQPSSGVLMVGQTFVMNMKNPHPRQRAKQESIMEEDEDDISDDRWHSILWHDDIRKSDMYLDTLKQLGDTLPHLIFALLTGRPVVVLSACQQRVHNTVQALSVFVPSQPKTQQHQVLHWFQNGTLTDVELDSIKLVGAPKANIDASIYKLDISCLDITDESHPNLITSPLYLDGYWVNQITDRIKFFSSDKSCFSYLQTVFMAMALKAFIYHHMYTLEAQRFSASSFAAVVEEINNKTPKSDYWDSSSSEGAGLTKKWSVRRIMSYLRRIEERDDGGDELATPAATETHEHDTVLEDFRPTSDDDDSDESSTDGMSLNERRGRRFLEQKLGIHGDDQNIVIYLANFVVNPL